MKMRETRGVSNLEFNYGEAGVSNVPGFVEVIDDVLENSRAPFLETRRKRSEPHGGFLVRVANICIRAEAFVLRIKKKVTFNLIH